MYLIYQNNSVVAVCDSKKLAEEYIVKDYQVWGGPRNDTAYPRAVSVSCLMNSKDVDEAVGSGDY